MNESPLCTGDPLAKALSVLEPMPTPLNRDQLMFAAGAAGRERDVAFWKRLVYGQATAACLLVGLGVAMYGFQLDGSRSFGSNGATAERTPPSGAPQEKPVTPTPAPVAVAAVPRLSELPDDSAKIAKYLELRSNILTLGVNVLSNPHTPPTNIDVGSLEDSLQLPRGTFAVHGLPTKKTPPKENPDE